MCTKNVRNIHALINNNHSNMHIRNKNNKNMQEYTREYLMFIKCI